MLSRVADAIYWVNRYVERAESVARFVDVNLHLSLDLPHGTSADWAPIVATTGDDAVFRGKYDALSRTNVLRFLTFDRDYPNSILSSLRMARENARSVREVISSEMWEQLNHLYLLVRDARSEDVLAAPHDFFAAVKQGSYTFVGTTYLTMSHNEAWHFGRLGRLIERADKTSRIVDVKYYRLVPDPAMVDSAVDDIQWGALLKSASGLEMYRKRHGRIAPATVVSFLLFDKEFPRSIQHCVRKAQESLQLLAPPGTTAEAELNRLVIDIEARGAQPKELLGAGLHAFCDGIQVRLNDVGTAIRETFFTPHELAPESAATRGPAKQTQTQSQSQSQTQTAE
jgi:uncharacterized alpha-E superfamily protein